MIYMYLFTLAFSMFAVGYGIYHMYQDRQRPYEKRVRIWMDAER